MGVLQEQIEQSTDTDTSKMSTEKYEKSHSFVIDQITELHIFEKFPLCKVNYNDVDEPAHLFLFFLGKIDRYAEVKVIIQSDRTHLIVLDTKPKCSASLEWAGVPMHINSVSDLEQLLPVSHICVKVVHLSNLKAFYQVTIVNKYFHKNQSSGLY